MGEGIEAREALHKTDSGELHFRFLGTARNRLFIVNVQFDAAEDGGGDKALRPEEYDFMVGKILRLILEHIGEAQNPALH
jgi:hypothetical protein